MGKLTRLIIYLIIGCTLVLLSGTVVPINAQSSPPPEEVAAKIYELLPDFPRENQYLNLQTNTRDENNTLVYRLISYHQFVKSRPLTFRFDWKLTLADYLGANETIVAESYPGAKTLSVNPLEGDKQAIASLNLRQRNQLVLALLSIYQPPAADNSPPSNIPENPTNQTPRLPQPGDAELLRP